MAQAKKKSKPKVAYKGYWNVNLTKQQDFEFDAWAALQTIQISDFDILANAGYKVSMQWDDFHGGVNASLYAADPKLNCAGFTLTAWAMDCETALKMLFYKHYELLKGNWETSRERSETTHASRG